MSADLTLLVFLPNADTTANTHNLRCVDRHVVKCPQLSVRASVLRFCWILLNILFMQAKIENIVNFAPIFAICLHFLTTIGGVRCAHAFLSGYAHI